MPLTFRWIRPKPYPENPTTLGEHLRRRRCQAGRTQKDAATIFGVNAWTYLLWEADRAKPTIRYYPQLFRFLGYDPFVGAITLGDRLKTKRRYLGLTVAAAAKLAGVDEGTFRRWERNEWRPRKLAAAVDAFLARDDDKRVTLRDGVALFRAQARN